MKKIAYIECPTGIAGDMCLGALVDAGVPVEYLAKMLNRLGIHKEYNLRAERVLRNSQQATKIHVELLSHPQTHQHVHAVVDPHSDPNSSSEHSHRFGDHHFSGDHPAESVQSKPGQSFNPHPAHRPASVALSKNQNLAQPQEHDEHHQHHEHEHHEHHKHHEHHEHGTRHLPEIEALIQAAHLPARVEAWSLAIFRQLAAAEGAVHGISPSEVHFHEVGATDAIVDIVGTCLGLDWLDIDVLYCSPLPTGGGVVRAAHGLLPVPAPAVLKLWEMRQVPIYSNGIQRELVTPTGAAIVTTLAADFGTAPTMTLQKVGLGAGSRDLEIPNILRLWIGEQEMGNGDRRSHTRDQKAASSTEYQSTNHQSANHQLANHQPIQEEANTPPTSLPTMHSIIVLETQVDDLSPQAIGYLFEALFAVGALDVFTQAIGMKKSRLGILLTVICHPDQADVCEAVIFRETTTLGIRRATQQRSILPREFHTVETPYGTVRMKVTDRGTQTAIVNAHPEYEDCAQLARQAKVPWQEVHRLALYQWYQTVQHSEPICPEPANASETTTIAP